MAESITSELAGTFYNIFLVQHGLKEKVETVVRSTVKLDHSARGKYGKNMRVVRNYKMIQLKVTEALKSNSDVAIQKLDMAILNYFDRSAKFFAEKFLPDFFIISGLQDIKLNYGAVHITWQELSKYYLSRPEKTNTFFKVLTGDLEKAIHGDLEHGGTLDSYKIKIEYGFKSMSQDTYNHLMMNEYGYAKTPARPILPLVFEFGETVVRQLISILRRNLGIRKTYSIINNINYWVGK